MWNVNEIVANIRKGENTKTFEELGIKKLDEEKLMEAATLACAEGDTAHNMPFEVTPESVYNAMLAADRIGHYYKDYE